MHVYLDTLPVNTVEHTTIDVKLSDTTEYFKLNF
jgi:hypothetical protein